MSCLLGLNRKPHRKPDLEVGSQKGTRRLGEKIGLKDVGETCVGKAL